MSDLSHTPSRGEASAFEGARFHPANFLHPTSNRELLGQDLSVGIPIISRIGRSLQITRVTSEHSLAEALVSLPTLWMTTLLRIRSELEYATQRFAGLHALFKGDRVTVPNFFSERDTQLFDGKPSRVVFYSPSFRNMIISIPDFIAYAHQLTREYPDPSDLQRAIEVWVPTHAEFTYHEWGHIAAKSGLVVPRNPAEFAELMTWRRRFLAEQQFSKFEMHALYALEQDGLAEMYRATLPLLDRNIEIFGAYRFERIAGYPGELRQPPSITRESVLRLAMILIVLRQCGPESLVPLARETFKSWIRDDEPSCVSLFMQAVGYAERFLGAHRFVEQALGDP